MALPIGARTNIESELARLKRGVARRLVYAGLADVLILWGAILLLNDLLIVFTPRLAVFTLVFGVAGLFGTWAISQVRARSPAHADNARRLFWSFVAFFLGLLFWQALGIPAPIVGPSLAQLNASVMFQLTFTMLGLITLGIWVGWELIGLGLGVILILVVDFALAPAFQFVGSAILVSGCALLAAGGWMRLSAREIRVDPLAVTR